MQTEPESTPDICAIVVTYQPPASVIHNVKVLSGQFSKVVVVDNGSAAGSRSLLAELESLPTVSFIRNTKNLGIAAALNQGIKSAKRLGFQWIATFDQDSTIPKDYVKSMMRAYRACALREKVALISPTHSAIEANPSEAIVQDTSSPYCFVPVTMSSGCVVKTSVLDEIGGYDEPLFIDYVDFDFCLRLRSRGFQAIQSTQTLLLHHLGTLEKHSFIGFPVMIKSHNAVRYYYIMRNRLTMYRRYGLLFPAWAAHDMMWLCMDLTKIVLFENAKPAKILNTLKGFWDALRGRLGPLDRPK